ncbi:MAG: hypothetical protein FJ104_07585, partial [Deltaproteobacteria bacterium]|nr:hypothetical protein [Deltaproteobacteria bacterium]
MKTPLGTLGVPGDAAGWLTLGLAVVLLLVARPLPWVSSSRLLVAALAVLAAALSAVYVEHYLRGGPRIVDATTYFLQARALSAGDVTIDVPAPTGSFRGRFLLAGDDGARIAGIFPPGYPAVLALGFLVGHPLAVGPLLAALLVAATAALAYRLHGGAEARLAAGLSAVCVALRYHTADTMSHGLGALLFTLVLLGA